MEERRSSAEGSLDEGHPQEAPELPTGKAFVVQLSRETSPTLEPFAGRVEHLATGRRLRFESFTAFQAAVIHLLAQARET